MLRVLKRGAARLPKPHAERLYAGRDPHMRAVRHPSSVYVLVETQVDERAQGGPAL